jgi:hypothetical protein
MRQKPRGWSGCGALVPVVVGEVPGYVSVTAAFSPMMALLVM